MTEKVAQNVGYFCNFQKTAQSKQSPIGRNNLVTLMPLFHGWAARMQIVMIIRPLQDRVNGNMPFAAQNNE
jgi:hypothetical protein